MDNYLSHRWPKGPGVQPVPMPAPMPTPRQGPEREKRRWPRRLAVVLCVTLLLAALFGVSFWSVTRLADSLGGLDLPDSSGGGGTHSYPDFFASHSSNWTVDDLPWGSPDPSVQLSLDSAGEDALSASDIYQKVLPSIVYIQVETEEGGGAGTGVVVTRSGYILTNYHVIDESTKIQVMPLTDQSAYYDAKVIGFDEDFDIAVLKVQASGLVPASLGDSDALSIGDTVYALGNPLGHLLGSMTPGIVSGLNRDEELDGSGIGCIQTSAALNPGNSGGALINEQGQVVGLTFAKLTGLIMDEDSYSVEDAAVIEGIGLVLPTSDILPFVNHILATGRSCRPSIGITCSQTRQYGKAGVIVREVNDGVPAQEAGLAVGDFIIAANGQTVAALTDLRRVLYRAGVDGEVTCTVLRDGDELEITFSLIDSLLDE